MTTSTIRFFTIWLLLGLGGCGAVLQAAGYPPEATRKTPPPGIERTALTVGAPTPELSLQDTGGQPHALGGPAERQRVVVFYRGAW